MLCIRRRRGRALLPLISSYSFFREWCALTGEVRRSVEGQSGGPCWRNCAGLAAGFGVLRCSHPRGAGSSRRAPTNSCVTLWLGPRHDARAHPAGAARGESCALTASLMPAPQSFVVSDPNLPDCPIIFASDGFIEYTGCAKISARPRLRFAPHPSNRCALCSYTREEVLGRNCRFLQGPDTDRRAVREIRSAIENRVECTVRLLNYTKQGRAFWNLFSIAPVLDANGNVRYFIGVQVDVTLRHARLTLQNVPKETRTNARARFWQGGRIERRPGSRFKKRCQQRAAFHCSAAGALRTTAVWLLANLRRCRSPRIRGKRCGAPGARRSHTGAWTRSGRLCAQL